MKMRTLNQAMDAIRAQDPGTALTPHALRRAVLSGIVPCVHAGRKRLIDIDRIEEYLAAETAEVTEPTVTNGIRRIEP
ncbi:MAG: hypothetical protein LBN00_11600 [Oscillospiraceae bacterium]|jgi:hypothetical protein|nr:hypothetical protein [Oscillospiraceae bacterium]